VHQRRRFSIHAISSFLPVAYPTPEDWIIRHPGRVGLDARSAAVHAVRVSVF
jgi:hypothetical protein